MTPSLESAPEDTLPPPPKDTVWNSSAAAPEVRPRRSGDPTVGDPVIFARPLVTRFPVEPETKLFFFG